MASSAVRQIAGRVSVITGGASGLGRGTVERFVRNGARVVIADLPSSPGEEVASSLGESAIFVPTDVTSEADVKNLMATTKDKFGKLDVAINCAGIGAAVLTFNPKKPDPEARIHNLELFQVISYFVCETCSRIKIISDFVNITYVDKVRKFICNLTCKSSFW